MKEGFKTWTMTNWVALGAVAGLLAPAVLSLTPWTPTQTDFAWTPLLVACGAIGASLGAAIGHLRHRAIQSMQ